MANGKRVAWGGSPSTKPSPPVTSFFGLGGWGVTASPRSPPGVRRHPGLTPLLTPCRGWGGGGRLRRSGSTPSVEDTLAWHAGVAELRGPRRGAFFSSPGGERRPVGGASLVVEHFARDPADVR
jgi:hypothetical protein